MSEDFFDTISALIKTEVKNVNTLSPLVLAYIGDAVYEVYIRTYLVTRGNSNVFNLHKASIKFVQASAQCDIIHRLMPTLSEEEVYIVKRGRNAKSGTMPKNADVTQYKYATGFEALVGYLYLQKKFERLNDIMNMAIEIEKNDN
jgi:ribonuclease III family protein